MPLLSRDPFFPGESAKIVTFGPTSTKIPARNTRPATPKNMPSSPGVSPLNSSATTSPAVWRKSLTTCGLSTRSATVPPKRDPPAYSAASKSRSRPTPRFGPGSGEPWLAKATTGSDALVIHDRCSRRAGLTLSRFHDAASFRRPPDGPRSQRWGAITTDSRF
jgi:hypothetical protein